ncbi:MAG: T9SS type A sorting domain-containing protein [Bacteroidota bacterium]|nr:T9SS type A sorting domain-containing protein [Bacteroidota bacterium]
MLLVSQISEAQNSEGDFHVNILKARLNSNGFLFDSLGSFGLRTNSGMPLAMGSGIWMSANDSQGNLRVSAHNVLGNNHDFWAGPLELNSGNAANPSFWNKVYAISKEEVTSHQLNFKKSNYQMSDKIKYWPGSGVYPYAKVLAPFVDLNENNQVYEPDLGDYPYFKGDAILYSIYNDNYANHTYTNALPLGIEVHTSVFAFKMQNILDSCIIVRHVLFNRSGRDYQNFRFSNVTNFKIGSVYNEFLGTDVRNNTLFAINDTSEATFSHQLVSLGCMSLNKPLSSTMYFNNDNDVINGRPVAPNHFQYLMSGKWKNNKILNYGSNGVDGSSNAKFVYPYDTDDSQFNLMWNEESVGNLSGQRIGMMNFDSALFRSSSVVYYDFVYFNVNEIYNNIKQIDNFCLRIKKALSSYNILNIPNKIGSLSHSFALYPNPLKSGEKISILKPSDLPTNMTIFDMSGKEVFRFVLEKSKESINLPNDLKSGVYFVKFSTLNNIEIKKIIINE